MDAERALLPHLTRTESLSILLSEGLRSEHFADEEVAEMFDSAINYYLQSRFQKALTREALEADYGPWIARRGWPDEEYEPKFLADRIKTKYQRHSIQDVLRYTGELVMEDPALALVEGISGLSKVQLGTATRSRMEVYSERFSERIEEYLDSVLNEGDSRAGLFLGWPEVSEETNGIKPPELGVVVGFAGIGKSWTQCKIALEAARRGTRVYLASLENSKELTLMRLDCLVSGVPFRDYERGTLSRDQIESLKGAKEVVASIGDTLIIDAPQRRTERTIFELYSRASYYGCEFFVGDQLSRLTPSERIPDPTERMTSFIEDISDITKEVGMASVWAAQYNREVQRSRRRGGLHNIALSSAVEQTVDWAFALEADEQIRNSGGMLFRILKARRSRPVSWEMEWQLEDRTDLQVRRVFNEEEY